MASLPPDDSHTRVATSPSVVVGPFLASVGCLIAHHNEQPALHRTSGFLFCTIERTRDKIGRSGREDLNLCPLTGFFSRNPRKSLVSNGSHNRLRLSFLLFGHIWT